MVTGDEFVVNNPPKTVDEAIALYIKEHGHGCLGGPCSRSILEWFFDKGVMRGLGNAVKHIGNPRRPRKQD